MTDYTRFCSNLSAVFEAALRTRTAEFSQHLEQYCGSPIEAMMGCAIFYTLRIFMGEPGALILASTSARKNLPEIGAVSLSPNVLMVPQYPFKNYRIDWAVFWKERCVFIECDGHDFHERTKEQAAHDRAKDRAIQAAGVSILRFTGSEIFNDPSGCVCEVVNFVFPKQAAA